MRHRKAILTASVITALFAATPAVAGEAELGEWGIDLEKMDKSVDPGDDFFRYVSGTWLKNVELPKGLPIAGAFIDVILGTETQLKQIVADLRKEEHAPNSIEGQIVALYNSYLDEDARAKQGLSPIQSDLDAIMAAKTHSDIARLMSKDIYPVVGSVSVQLDEGNPERYLTVIDQRGLVLGEREFYLNSGEPYASIRKAYLAHVEKMAGLIGLDNPRERAEEIVGFETALASGFWSGAQRRDPVRMYHKMTIDDFLAYAPGMDWKARFEAAGLTGVDEVVVNADSGVQHLARTFASTPVDTLQSYMAYRLVNGNAQFLSPEIEKAEWEFSGRVLQGAKEQRGIEERAFGMIGLVYGEPLGKLYAERYLTPETKTEVEKMIGFMRAAFNEKFQNNPWMDDATKAEAIDKLEKLNSEVGYPSKFHDYSSMTFSSDDLFGNLRQIAEWRQKDSAAKLHEPHRTWEWYRNPQEINAYFAPPDNEIIVLSAILQPPFFDPNADPAVNFGAVGAVIGHELGHGFDDSGAQYDGKGRLRNWWSEASLKAFKERGDILAAQYDTYSPVEGAKVNGRLTLGENLGDLGGVSVAYAAYRRFVDAEQGGKAPVIDGFTGDQRFFMGWAQLWAQYATPQYWKQIVLTDVHSPGEFRINGVMRNIDAWYKAFDVTPEDDLYLPPEKRVRLW